MDDILLSFLIFSYGFKAFIMSEGVKRCFTGIEVIALAPFIRFQFVRINLFDTSDYEVLFDTTLTKHVWTMGRRFQSFEERCKQSIAFLQQIHASAFTYLTLEIQGVIRGDKYRYTEFRDHRQILDYAKNLVIPIFNACRRYQFKIYFLGEKDAVEDLLAHLLQLEPI